MRHTCACTSAHPHNSLVRRSRALSAQLLNAPARRACTPVLVRYLGSKFPALVHADDVLAPPEGEAALAAVPMPPFDLRLLRERLAGEAAGGASEGGASEGGEGAGAEAEVGAPPPRRRRRKRKLPVDAPGACARRCTPCTGAPPR